MARAFLQRIVELMTQVEDADIFALIVHKDVFGGRHPTGLESDARGLVFKIAHIFPESGLVHAGRRILESVFIRGELIEQRISPFRFPRPHLDQMHGTIIYPLTLTFLGHAAHFAVLHCRNAQCPHRQT